MSVLKNLSLWLLLVCLLYVAIAPTHAQEKQDSINNLNYSKKDTTVSLGKAAANNSVADSSDGKEDTVVAKPKPYQPVPKKAGLYSAIIPGLGQAYNHQLWKVPIIYAGLAVAGYFISDNLNNYQLYRKAYISRINNPTPTDQFANIYSQSQLQQLQSDYNKYLDMSILYTVLGFSMQIVDAITSAHLKNFDVSRDISIKMNPIIAPNSFGLGIVMNF